eukprot:4297493-Prymnesium_polylepis.1
MSAIFSMNAALGQLARSIGPLATSGLYEAVNDKLGMGYATNCTTMANPCISLVASCIGFLAWRQLYGGLCDPSLRSIKRRQKQADALLDVAAEADVAVVPQVNG